jgi:phosphate transport system permease protein
MTRASTDRLLLATLRVMAASSALIVLLVVLYLVIGAWPALHSVDPLRFFTDAGWHPTDPEGGSFDLRAMLVGSLAATLGAMLVAGPLGFLSAIFVHFYAPASMRAPYRRMIELLAGIPSVVYGLWGLVALAPLVREIAPPGPSLLTGVLVLALMVVPTVAMLADAALQAVPVAQLQGAAALQFSRLSTLRAVVFPSARSGLGISVVLGTMRAIGETMAVLMVCGNVVRMPDSLFSPIRTLTANIALELGYATDEHRSVLFVSGLVLMTLVLLLVAAQEKLKGSAGVG